MNTLRRFFALLHKEMCQLLRAPKSRAILVVPPIMQIIILGYAATMDLKQVKFAVLDYNQTQTSRDLIAAFSGNTIFDQVAPLRSESEMGECISRRRIKLALVIPPNFERDMLCGKEPGVQVIADGRNTTSAGLALGYAQKIVEQFAAAHTSLGAHANGISISTRAWYNTTYNAQYYMVPAMLVMIGLLDVMLLTALAIAREREDGTMDQLLLTPYSSAEILLGKAASSLFVGICQLTVALLITLMWYKIPFTSTYPLLYLTLFSFLAASIGIGMFISVLCHNLQQAMLGSLVLVIPCAMISGLATPVESMPPFFQMITLANPMRHGIHSIQQIFLENTTLSAQLPTLQVLWLIAVLSGTLSLWILEHQRRS